MTTATANPTPKQGGARVAVQRFGTFLSGMVMPNIAAFIAWGLVTALFITDGWMGSNSPVEAWRWENSAMLGGGTGADGVEYSGVVGPMITILLPLLIAYTGGRMVHEARGGVVGATATMGVIIGGYGLAADGGNVVMLLGAMVLGPLTALALKWLEKLWDGKVRAGFEMLVNNFSAGFVAFFMLLAGFFWLAPVIAWFTTVVGDAVKWLVEMNLIPLASVIVEPAKVLFLNNALNHGVFTPIAANEGGPSLLYLVEANPGPGAGLLLAIIFFGVGAARATAPGALIIQFVGGIHEIYFPYVLAKPKLILALILGGASGVATNMLLGSGLNAPASPGSIIAVAIQTPAGSAIGVFLSVIISAGVTFAVASLLLIADRKKDLAAEEAGGGSFEDAIAKTQANKGKESSILGGLSTSGGTATATDVKNVVFACDAGMGSSAMGASVLRNKVKKAGIEGVTVTNKAIANLDGSEDLIVTQNQLTDRAKKQNDAALHVSVDNFMNSPKYDEVIDLLLKQQEDK